MQSFVHLLENIGYLILGVLLYSYVGRWLPFGDPAYRLGRQLLTGAAFGALAVLMMVQRIAVGGGAYVDARHVPVALIGLFEGWPAALVAAAIAVAYRISRGGSGALAGVLGLLAVAFLAALVHRRCGGAERVRPRHAFALGALVFLATSASFALLGSQGLELFARRWAPLLVVNVLGVGLIARLLHDTVERERLLVEHARFRAIVDEASDGIEIVNADTGQIVEANRKSCELSGCSREEMIRRHIREFWPSDRFEAGASRVDGISYHRRNGSIVTVDATRREVNYGGRRYQVIVFRDASDRLAREAAQQESAALRSVAELANAAAHEINNPLAAVVGGLDLLALRVTAGSTEAGWVGLAQRAAERIRDIVAHMRHITKLERAEPVAGISMLDLRKSGEPESPEPVKPEAPPGA
ncbi:MAG: PAS domain S-box protein [Candidatus Rokubacteria bacterium]|nr:PAS domain S-box protein [Candidatus Rokubacteria bacterium]